MTQNELLPIGTRLITKDLEIAAGLVEVCYSLDDVQNVFKKWGIT